MADEVLAPFYLGWLVASLGPFYRVVLSVVFVISFAGVLGIVIRGKTPMAAAALVLLTHAPMLVGIYAGLSGVIQICQVIGLTDTTPNAAEVAEGMSTSLVAPMVGTLLVSPCYVVVIIGLLIRSLITPKNSSSAPSYNTQGV